MSKINFILFLSLTFMFNSCSSDTYDGIRSGMAGNEPPRFFHFSTAYDANHYIFHQKSFDILMPQAKKNDWIEMEGWDGLYINGGDNGFAVGLDQKVSTSKGGWISYHISVSASGVSKYSERDDAIDRHNVSYIKTGFHRYQPNTKVSIQKHGKENYSCVVLEYTEKGLKDIKKQGMTYRCYKFNREKTKAKDVTISLAYTKAPNLPSKYKNLAKRYTYNDLQQRAKRTLDSLYIKDGW